MQRCIFAGSITILILRYFIEIAYDGTAYHGWQRQPNALTVQEELEKALTQLLRKDVLLTGAGRTDAGVHARQLFAHFDLSENLASAKCAHLRFRLNRFLAPSIAVQSIFRVNDDAHARFDATSRSYEYLITLKKDPFLVGKAYLLEQDLNFQAMNEAAELLLGKKDFKCFSRSKTDVKTYICEVVQAVWEHENDRYVFRVSADRFLRNMVRAMVGTLLEIGQNKRPVSAMLEIISGRDRTQAGASVPAHGLYLTRVDYPDSIYTTDGRKQ